MQLFPQTSAGAAVIAHRNDGAEITNDWLIWIGKVVRRGKFTAGLNVPLQPTQKRG